jgi:hypothetical protein
LFPDAMLRETHRNTYGESSFETRSGHVRNSGIGDLFMLGSPAVEAVAEAGSWILPGVTHDYDPSGSFKTGRKAAAGALRQTANTFYYGLDSFNIPDILTLGLMPEDVGRSVDALWGNSFVESIVNFNENKELLADTEQERKVILFSMVLAKSRSDIHINKFVLDVPRFREYKDLILQEADNPQMPQGSTTAISDSGQRFNSRGFYKVIQDAKERAEEADISLADYLDTDSGMATVEQRLNSLPLQLLPPSITSKIISDLGGYEGILAEAETWRSERERQYGPEDRQFGTTLEEGLVNALSNDYVAGTTVVRKESKLGTTLRYAGEALFAPAAETAVDLIVDPLLHAGGDLTGWWDYGGRGPSDGNGTADWYYGIENVESAGFYGRFNNIAQGLSLGETGTRRMRVLGLTFDVLYPGEKLTLTTFSRPFVGTYRLADIMSDLPGAGGTAAKLNIDTLRAAYLPDGIFGFGSLEKKYAPVQDIAEFERAVEVAEANAAARTAEYEASGKSQDRGFGPSFMGLRELMFGDAEVNLAKKRLRQANRAVYGIGGWRRSNSSKLFGPKPLRKKLGGLHDLTYYMAMDMFEQNVLSGKNGFEGLGSDMVSQIKETLRQAGIDPADTSRIMRDSAAMRTARFFSAP